MAKKPATLSEFMAGLGKDSAVFKRLQARQIGRNPPKSMSGSTTIPAPKVTTGSWKAQSPEIPSPAPKSYMGSKAQPELSKVLSRPLEAGRSARFTMGSAATRRLNNVRKSRGGK